MYGARARVCVWLNMACYFQQYAIFTSSPMCVHRGSSVDSFQHTNAKFWLLIAAYHITQCAWVRACACVLKTAPTPTEKLGRIFILLAMASINIFIGGVISMVAISHIHTQPPSIAFSWVDRPGIISGIIWFTRQTLMYRFTLTEIHIHVHAHAHTQGTIGTEIDTLLIRWACTSHFFPVFRSILFSHQEHKSVDRKWNAAD